MRTIKPFLMVATLSVMAACSHTTAPPPAVEVKIQRVEIPVAVACFDKRDLPAEPPRIAGKLTGDARRDLDVVSASALRLRVWGRELTAILSGCAK